MNSMNMLSASKSAVRRAKTAGPSFKSVAEYRPCRRQKLRRSGTRHTAAHKLRKSALRPGRKALRALKLEGFPTVTYCDIESAGPRPKLKSLTAYPIAGELRTRRHIESNARTIDWVISAHLHA